MNTNDNGMSEGGCTCGEVRYRLTRSPMVVHCCHCRWCQRETGTAFALNAMIETSCVSLLSGQPELVETPSNSGNGQQIARCPNCHIALWSHYAGAGKLLSFIRVGTMDNPDTLPPDIHIYTSTKQPWVILPPEDYAVDVFYEYENTWSKDSLKRRAALLADLNG